MVNVLLRDNHSGWSNLFLFPHCLHPWKSCELHSICSGMPAGPSTCIFSLAHQQTSHMGLWVYQLGRRKAGRQFLWKLQRCYQWAWSQVGHSVKAPVADGRWKRGRHVPQLVLLLKRQLAFCAKKDLKALKRFLACYSGLLLAILSLMLTFLSFDLNFDTCSYHIVVTLTRFLAMLCGKSRIYFTCCTYHICRRDKYS